MLHCTAKLAFLFSVRVRYAPSPTGPMHLGAVRTALFNYLFAKHQVGKFIVRIQDTDVERNVKDADKDILNTLNWLGIKPDESMLDGGPYGPYVQSQRLNLYRDIQKDLLRKGVAYPCFCSAPERNKKEKLRKQEPQTDLGYDGRCRKLSIEEVKSRIKNGEKYAIRIKSDIDGFKVGPFIDHIHGTVAPVPFDDYILVKKNGYPTYHFANVIDDWKMDITHVIRGVEWLTNTSKHIYLYNVLGAKPPIFVHLPLILTNDGKKLSKRDPTTPIANLKAKGYLAQAIVNYTGLMGFNLHQSEQSKQDQTQKSKSKPNQKEKSQQKDKQKQKQKQINEFFSLQELTKIFELDKIKNSPVKSDAKKLNYFNRFHMKRKWKEQDTQFVNQIFETFRTHFKLDPNSKQYSQLFLKDVVDCVLERVNIVEDFKEYGYFFSPPNLFSETATKDIKKIFGPDSTLDPQTLQLLTAAVDKIEKGKKILHNLTMIFKHIISPQEYNEKKIAETISQFVYDNRADLENQDVYHLLRLAVTGMKSGVNIVKTCDILGRDRVLSDLEKFSKCLVSP